MNLSDKPTLKIVDDNSLCKSALRIVDDCPFKFDYRTEEIVVTNQITGAKTELPRTEEFEDPDMLALKMEHWIVRYTY